MTYLERLQAKAAMNASGAPSKGSEGAFDPFESELTGCCGDLPTELIIGLRRLAIMPTPRLILPEGWPAAVADALMLARDGWVSKALALGWEPLDLFRAVTDRDGYADADGLAVWLGGRPVRAICATHATFSDGIRWAFFNRRDRLGTTLLWDIGKDAKG